MSEHWAVALLKELEAENFYGKASFEFRKGELVLIRKEETILPPTNGKTEVGK